MWTHEHERLNILLLSKGSFSFANTTLSTRTSLRVYFFWHMDDYIPTTISLWTWIWKLQIMPLCKLCMILTTTFKFSILSQVLFTRVTFLKNSCKCYNLMISKDYSWANLGLNLFSIFVVFCTIRNLNYLCY